MVVYMSKLWHIWEFPDKIRIRFSERFRKRLYEELRRMCGTREEIANRLGVDSETIKTNIQTGKNRSRKGEFVDCYISVKLVKKILEYFGKYSDINFLKSLESNIVGYRAWNGWIVKNPEIPIKESPELYSIVFHLLGDGNASKRHSPYYSNMCRNLIDNFVSNLHYFGGVECREDYRKDGLVYVRFPKAISDILSYILDIDFVKPKKLPRRIFDSNSNCKISAVKAFIDDEGCVSTSFSITQKSENLLKDLKRLLLELGINTGKVCNNGSVKQIYIFKNSYKTYFDKIGFVDPKKTLRLEEKLRS